MLSTNLQLIFRNAIGRNVTITIPEPRNPLTAAEVKTAMDSILAGNYFQTAGGDLREIVGARIISRDSNDLAIV